MFAFKKISKYANVEIPEPVRKTGASAGYDMVAAEDITIPSYWSVMDNIKANVFDWQDCKTLDQMAAITKEYGKPTLIPTGYKAYMDKNYYLQLSIRSSSPLKYWLILANGVGVIDADYADNSSNEGHIYFQVINLSPCPLYIKAGEVIGQATFIPYGVTDDDKADGDRTGGFGSTGTTL